MKKFTKFFAVLMAAVMAMTAMCVSAGAAIYVYVATKDTLLDTANAKAISSGVSYSGDTSKKSLNWYKFTTSQSGTFKVTYSTNGSNTNFYLFDNKGTALSRGNTSNTTGWIEGSDATHIFGHSTDGKFAVTTSFNVGKGTYYIVICPGWQDVSYGGTYSFSTSFPDAGSSSATNATTKDTMLKVYIEEGDSLKIGAVVGGKNASSVTYSSSNSKIAKVSAKGKIKAVTPGTAVITVKSGSTTIKVQVVVEEDD